MLFIVALRMLLALFELARPILAFIYVPVELAHAEVVEKTHAMFGCRLIILKAIHKLVVLG